ncbi:hypothetical protein ALC53_05495 [Atta colombica]|uniref:Uncharacterized protein n=1 Tax=Atta colombica TaxID=520822 RepID=A0A195BIH5_9HYME|nr:hypothetical protein ALC53_05495 [Atta colombica]
MIFAEVASRVGLLGKVNLPRELSERARSTCETMPNIFFRIPVISLTIPWGLSLFLRRLLHPQVPWHMLLAANSAQSLAASESLGRPSCRFQVDAKCLQVEDTCKSKHSEGVKFHSKKQLTYYLLFLKDIGSSSLGHRENSRRKKFENGETLRREGRKSQAQGGSRFPFPGTWSRNLLIHEHNKVIIVIRECQTREWRNYETATAWNKEKSRKGKKEIKEAAVRCRHLDHGTHFASLISRKDSVRVTGVFRLQGLLGTRGSSPVSYEKNLKDDNDNFLEFIPLVTIIMFITRNNNMQAGPAVINSSGRARFKNQEMQQRADIIDHTKVMNQYIAGNAFCLRGTFLLRQPYLPSDSRAILARRRCAADAFRTLVAFLCPLSPLSPRFSRSSSFHHAFRFLFSIFTSGSSGCHGGERELKSEQHRDDITSDDATEVRKVTARVDVKCLFSRVEGVPASSPRAVLPHESVLSRRAVTSLRGSPRESQN